MNKLHLQSPRLKFRIVAMFVTVHS